ncbi:chemotaxis protein CheW [Noviherbaspirillum galbum]|uniref:Chemotaxis protein CheW n=1 Tax=Noviherbaspirillum galbum TaxID=2709383 RepID=A0A6B3SGG5_9BURK|nr:chemotaxis protein CheW [Noviherbaspirillum galbum]NEX59954.1 chemotaxis protein CheW [Noviherbaspirillum galbum]
MTDASVAATTANTDTADTSSREFLAFKLGNEEYGIDILKVQELRGYEQCTHIASAPDYIKGVVNLRGIIVPIIDLRIRFQLGTPTYDQFTVVIILHLQGQTIGMVVDGVSDVIAMAQHQIKPPPELGNAINTEYLLGLGTIEERMLILMDIDRLMSGAELGLLERKERLAA